MSDQEEISSYNEGSEEGESSDQESKDFGGSHQMQRNLNGHNCKICFLLYTQSKPPRLLPCGHTCCTPCLTKILHKNRRCPMCRERLLNASVEEYKINYALMEVCEEFYNSPWCIDALRRRLELLKNEHKRILSSAKEVASICLGNMPKISSMESDEKKIVELIGKEDDEINGKEAHKSLDAMETLMLEVEASFPTRNTKIRRTLSPNTCYNLKEFNDPSQFINKIYKEVGNGQNFESLSLINGARKAARITVNDNALLFHAFRSSRDDKLAKHVEFSDLKNVFLRGQIFAFLNLTYTDTGINHRIFIENFSQSVLISTFLKLCTGESGPSYLDSTFTSSVVDFNSSQRVIGVSCLFGSSFHNELQSNPESNQPYLINIVGNELSHKLDCEEQYHEYASKLTNDLSALPKATCYLALKKNGTLKIGTFKEKDDLQECTIIGTIIGNTNEFAQKLQRTKNGIVSDCGIAVML